MIKQKEITVSKELEKFLKEKGMYEAFHNNVDKCESIDGGAFVNELSTAFIWYETPEGLNYWRSLDKEFSAL